MNSSLVDTLAEALASAEISVVADAPDSVPGRIRVVLHSKHATPIQISARWVGEGWPGELQRAFLENDAEAKEAVEPVVWVARRFSKGALEILKNQNCNWADARGNVHLALPTSGIHIHIDGNPRSAVVRSLGDWGWSPAMVDVAEYLLRDCSSVQLDTVAMRTSWSRATVSNALNRLRERGWVARLGPPRGRGVEWSVVQPDVMLDALAESRLHRMPEVYEAYCSYVDPAEFASTRLARAFADTHGWALTGWLAMNLREPYFSHVPAVQVYLHEASWHRLPELMNRLGASPVASGNLQVWKGPLPGPWRQIQKKEQGVREVSSIRLYQDLIALGGRGKDAARRLRETKIGF